MTLYRLRWLPTASGFVGQFAGQWADRKPTHDRGHLVDLQRAMPNGAQTEIVTIEENE